MIWIALVLAIVVVVLVFAFRHRRKKPINWVLDQNQEWVDESLYRGKRP